MLKRQAKSKHLDPERDRIRVLQIISGFAIEGPLGGIERFGIELVQALNRSMIEPIVCGMWAYATPYEHNWVSFLQEQGIEAFIAADWDEASPYRSFWHAYRNISMLFARRQVDIIHSHCQFGDVLALLFKRQLGAKAVIRTVHNEREWGKRPLRRLFLTNFLYPWFFDLELGVSQQVVDNLNQRSLTSLLKKPAVKSYNALNVSRFDNVEIDRVQKRASLGLPAEAFVIGNIGRLTEQKGQAILLTAAAIILGRIPTAHFLIIGNGPLEQSLREKAHCLGIEQKVIFTGARRDVEEMFAIMDVFVNSSLWEGLPTVIMESMAAHVPVVATEVSGTNELIKDGVTGYLVAPSSPEQMAQAVELIFTTRPEEIKAMCHQAHQFVHQHFSIQSIASQHNAIYQALI